MLGIIIELIKELRKENVNKVYVNKLFWTGVWILVLWALIIVFFC